MTDGHSYSVPSKRDLAAKTAFSPHLDYGRVADSDPSLAANVLATVDDG